MTETAPRGARVGAELHALIRDLYPLCRSITGSGVRETLRRLQRVVPLELREVPSGTQVFDWTVPDEWNLREAWIAKLDGTRVVDLARSSLHVVSYSEPVRRRIPLAELRAHLHSLPAHPDWIPYRTSYYNRTWGFCVTQRQLEALTDPEYEVCVDATLAPGHLSYGEFFVPGRESREILVSTHVCHPSLCNDNLSGIALAALLARRVAERRPTLGHRFLWIPGTIGSLTWLARNPEARRRVAHGLTLVCLGDASPFTYKRTLAGDADVDRAARVALRDSGLAYELVDFSPFGYDERQYNSPAFRMPVGSLMRARHGEFPEYHTSADDLSFVSAQRLEESYGVCSSLLDLLDGDVRYRNLSPEGEPQLGRRGIYRAMGGEPDLPDLQLAMLWLLQLCDGSRSLLDVVERARLPFPVLRRAADLLVEHGLLGEAAAGA